MTDKEKIESLTERLAAAAAEIAALGDMIALEKKLHSDTVSRMQKWIDEANANRQVEQAALFEKSQELIELKEKHRLMLEKYDPQIRDHKKASLREEAAKLREQAANKESEADAV